MKSRLSWLFVAGVVAGWLGLAQNGRAVSACTSARFNDWKDLGLPRLGCYNGMTRWWVSKPYMNLWMEDIPLSYATSSGQRMEFKWTYCQREGFSFDQRLRVFDMLDEPTQVPIRIRGAPQGYLTNYSAAWCHNWFSEVVFWDLHAETSAPPLATDHSTYAYLQYSSNYEALVLLGNGGTLYFNGTNASTPNGALKARLEIIGQTSAYGGPEVPVDVGIDGIYPYGTTNVWVDNPQYGFRLIYPDGSQDLYGFVKLTVLYGQSPRGCPYPSGDPRCGTDDGNGHQTGGAQNYNGRAYLTHHIDPQGRITRLGYNKIVATGQPNFNVGYVVDPDGRTNTYYYDPSNASKLLRIVDTYGRTNAVAYDSTQHLLSSITDGAGLVSSFQYQPPVTIYVTNSGHVTPYTTLNGWATSLTTPYGLTGFRYAQLQEAGATTEYQWRAVLIGEPDAAHQLFFYKHAVPSTVAESLPATPVVTNYVFDDGVTGSNHPEFRYRDCFEWGRRQFAALSVSDWNNLTNALDSLTDADYHKARLDHWLLDSSDQISITANLSVRREPSSDAAGQIDGAWSCYAYPDKPAGEPQMAGTETYPSCLAQVLPDGTTQFTEWDYTTNGLLLQQRESYTLASGSVGVRTNFFAYSTNQIDLISITNQLGQYVNFGYNTNHQVTVMTNALGQISTLGYHATTHNLTNAALVGGQSVSLSYYVSNAVSANGNQLSNIVWSPTGRSLTFTWTNGLPRIVRATGTGIPDLWFTNAWDGLNRNVGTVFQDGTSISNIYDRLHLGATKDRLGNWTRYGYDGLEHVTSITNALNNVTKFSWCDCGALNSVIDALTNTTIYHYNNQGLLTNILFADNSSANRTYDAVQRLIQVDDGQGRALKVGYNNQGLVTVLSNSLGALERVVYDAADRAIQVTDAGNVTITNVFDPLNRISARIWFDGAGESYGWATNGLIASTNRNGRVTRYARDNAGRLTAVTNANLETVLLGYNSLSQVTDLWDGRTNHTVWHYNQFGWVTNKVDALNREIVRYTYDAGGRVTNRWMPASGNTGYGYDAVGNLRSIAYPNQTIDYTYNALNQLRTMADAIGTTVFSNTPTGNALSETTPWGGTAVNYGYSDGLRTSMSVGSQSFGYGYDQAWRMRTLTSPSGTFNYDYEAARPSFLSTILLPNSAWVTNHYDSLSRLDYTALVNSWGHVLDGYGYAHDLLGLRTNIVRELGLTTNSVSVGYDAIGQITSWSAKEAAGTLRLNEQLGWAYDKSDNLLFRTNGALVQTFNCDPVNELTNITRAGTMTVSGNTPAPATSVTVNGLTAQTNGDFTFAATNISLANGANLFTNIAANAYSARTTNILTLYLTNSPVLRYDLNGNLTNDGTRSFAYNAENQLTNIVVTNAATTASTKTEFVYDGLGRRRIARDYTWTGTWSKTNETRFIYDGYLLMQERDTNNNVLVTYTRGLDLSGSLAGAGGIGGLLARTDAIGSTFYHGDGAGNVTALIDGQQNISARYMYGPFGKVTGKWGAMVDINVMQFSSMPTHRQSGLSVYSVRAYDPTMQRWLQSDPIGEIGGINLYGFVHNNGLSYIDPSGEDFHVTSGAGGFLQPTGPLGYLMGDTVVENVAAGAYNILPNVGNRASYEFDTVMGLLEAFDQGMEDSLTFLTGDPQLGNALNNVFAGLPIGWGEDAAKLARARKLLADAEKAALEAKKLAEAGRLARAASDLKVCISVAEKAKLRGAVRDVDYFLGIIDKEGNIKLFKAGNGIAGHDDLVARGLAKMGEDLGFSAGLDANGAVQVANMSQLNAHLGLGGKLPAPLYDGVKQALGAK